MFVCVIRVMLTLFRCTISNRRYLFFFSSTQNCKSISFTSACGSCPLNPFGVCTFFPLPGLVMVWAGLQAAVPSFYPVSHASMGGGKFLTKFMFVYLVYLFVSVNILLYIVRLDNKLNSIQLLYIPSKNFVLKMCNQTISVPKRIKKLPICNYLLRIPESDNRINSTRTSFFRFWKHAIR